METPKPCQKPQRSDADWKLSEVGLLVCNASLANVIWFQLETWTSAKSMDTRDFRLTSADFIKKVLKEYEWLMEAKPEQISMQLQNKILDVGNFEIPELYRSTMNEPIMICWPKAMKYYRREDFMREMYPKAARFKNFGVKTHLEQFKRALKMAE